MNNTINYTLIEEALAIFRDIPEDKVGLNNWYENDETAPACGTIACGIGHLSLCPKFQDLGLVPFKQTGGWWTPSFAPDLLIYKLFGGGIQVVFDALFCAYGEGTFDGIIFKSLRRPTHKELLIARCEFILANRI